MPVLPRWAPGQRGATVRRTAERRQTVALAPSGCTPSICRAETAAARYHALKSGVKCEEPGRGSQPQPAGPLREHGPTAGIFSLTEGTRGLHSQHARKEVVQLQTTEPREVADA